MRTNRLRAQAEKVRLWSSTPTRPLHIGRREINPEACVDFLGLLLSGGRNEPVRHRATAARAKFWAIKPALTTRVESLQSRLKRLLAEVFPIFAWGCTARHLRRGSFRLATAAMIIMRRIMMKAHRADPDTGMSSPVVQPETRSPKCADTHLLAPS